MAQLIDGKAIAAKVRAEAKAGAERLKAERGITPGIAFVRVGEDPASKTYVGSKKKAAEEAGFRSWEHHLNASASEAEVLALVERLNADAAVHGILVQLPLPPHLDAGTVVLAVRPEKDVDGLHPVNAGRLVAGQPGFRPCTPYGVMRLLQEIQFSPSGKRAVVVGRSALVGKPMALLLLEANATVTICHRKSDLPREVADGDLVVAAAGVEGLVKGSWIKPGAVVIDVGINRNAQGKLTGDVEFAAASERAAFITPVPGGVGPMTVAMLMLNTLQGAGGLSP
ncbi:MAG TPA: bifunctional methylenetetrahydrofolate dehydrogenase/methenyltetrahydrofolate cyclohydrolase FolD [Myxococcaceae bacterium]|nr:bifunctional methylenetetrahydrofolate dehydrogenase/methenyltetrahydrofolate cyclohydrolase FolD [Myxococcaceae bacterium]